MSCKIKFLKLFNCMCQSIRYRINIHVINLFYVTGEHNFSSFYEQEIAFRSQYGNPPFNRLVYLVYTHTNAGQCQREAERLARLLMSEIDSQGLANTALIGPSPAYAQRVRGRYRWQLIIRSPDPMAVLSEVPIPQGWTVDIDPVGLA